MNLALNADFYTVCSDDFASEDCRTGSLYNFTNRYSPKKHLSVANDSRMVFYGLSHYLKRLRDRVTREDIKLASDFMSQANSFGGSLPFNTNMWNRVVTECDGYLPIQIQAIPEGSTFFPNEPVIQVRNTRSGFGELAAHIEASLVGTVSTATVVATLCRHWLQAMRNEVKNDLILSGNDNPTAEEIDNIARFQIHNFGKRASSTDEESVIFGMAHLLSFYGTDNTDAAYEAWLTGAEHPTGTSILALAHRNVQGYSNEIDTVKAIANSARKSTSKVKICACVADCYNYNNFVDMTINEAIANPDVIYVIRPDSGDCFETIYRIFKRCIDLGCHKYLNGYAVPKNVRFIYGDSVSPDTQLAVIARLRKLGMLPTLWGIWGVGGYIRNTATRDTFSSAYKLAQMYPNKPVVKLSESLGKMSIPYDNMVLRHFDSNMTGITVCPVAEPLSYDGRVNILQAVWREGHCTSDRTSFKEISKRSIENFDSFNAFSALNPDFGLTGEHLSDIIKAKREEIFNRYRS